MTDLAIIADDLSGAAESAAACFLRTMRIDVRLATDDTMTQVTGETADRVVVIDTDSRNLQPDQAADRVSQALSTVADARLVIKKVDSILRGNLASEVAALVDSSSEVVVCTALPALNRTVINGVPMIDGLPLADTDLWDAETVGAPASIADALAPLAVHLVPGAVLEQGVNAVAAELAAANRANRLPVCDARTDADLDLVLAAAVAIWRRPVAVGSAAMAAAAARTLAADRPVRPTAHRPRTRRNAVPSLLAVVGSAARNIAEQRAQLASLVDRTIDLDPAALLDPTRRSQLRDAVTTATAAGGFTLVAMAQDASVDPAQSRVISAAVTEVVGAAALSADALLLTGGETARSVLDRLNVHHLVPLHQVHHGAVICSSDTGHLVATRPGSFGDADSLAAIAAALQAAVLNQPPRPAQPFGDAMTAPALTADQPTTGLPYIAVTMGDGAGVGPEVVIRALLDPQITAILKAVVVGDALRLRQAADLLGVEVDIVTVATVSDAEFVPGRINVIDLNLLPADLPFGVLSPIAGDAAFHYIRVASELAMSGQVQAICTAPLNKEALHAGGHIFPGHTELLASLTGTKEVSMMLSTPKVNVIHVTTHIGLVDAIKKIEPGLVERTIRRGYTAMVNSGIASPKIGVCAINPHAGENGLFGQGEEESKINPAVRVCQADGIDVTGALPADTLFFLAGRGDYDLVVAMYHDQGHGPVKVLGLEAGVNITVGLPVIRTSVDHGTAFDIAGKGIADPGSMVEALRQAAEMAPKPTS